MRRPSRRGRRTIAPPTCSARGIPAVTRYRDCRTRRAAAVQCEDVARRQNAERTRVRCAERAKLAVAVAERGERRADRAAVATRTIAQPTCRARGTTAVTRYLGTEAVAPGASPRCGVKELLDERTSSEPARAAPSERGWLSPSPNEVRGTPTELPWPHAPSRSSCVTPEALSPSLATETAAPGAPPRCGVKTLLDERTSSEPVRAAPREQGWLSPSPDEARGVPTEPPWPPAPSRIPRVAPKALPPLLATKTVAPDAPPRCGEKTLLGEWASSDEPASFEE